MDLFDFNEWPFLFCDENGNEELIYARTYEEAIKKRYQVHFGFGVKINYPFNSIITDIA